MIGGALCIPDTDNAEVRVRRRVRTFAGDIWNGSTKEPTGEVCHEKDMVYNRLILWR